MNYRANTITVGELRQRLAELVATGRYARPPEDEPQDTYKHIAWCDAWGEFEEAACLEKVLLQCRHCNNSDTLVNEDYWVQFCEIRCYDLGLVQPDSVVAVFCDWEKVSERIKETEGWKEIGSVDGVTFLLRG